MIPIHLLHLVIFALVFWVRKSSEVLDADGAMVMILLWKEEVWKKK
jgi:hypothetical protein